MKGNYQSKTSLQGFNILPVDFLELWRKLSPDHVPLFNITTWCEL
jgi:hypothetical protein